MLIMSISTDEGGQSEFCIPATKQDEDNIKGQSWSMAEVTLCYCKSLLIRSNLAHPFRQPLVEVLFVLSNPRTNQSAVVAMKAGHDSANCP